MNAEQPLRIAMRQMVGQSPGPHLLIAGGVHGDEFEPMAAIRRLMKEIVLKTFPRVEQGKSVAVILETR